MAESRQVAPDRELGSTAAGSAWRAEATDRRAPLRAGLARLAVLLAGITLASVTDAVEPPLEPGSKSPSGFPLITDLGPTLPEDASPANYAAALDRDGRLYLGNLGGLLVYDGAWWHTFRTGTESAVHSLAADALGRVAVGGVGDLGLVEPAEDGSLRYRSLADRLPPDAVELGDVVGVQPTETGFAFLTDRALLLWNGTDLRQAALLPPGGYPPALFSVGGEIFVWDAQGLARLSGRELAATPGGESFAGRPIDLMLPAEPGTALVAVRGEGLFLLQIADGVAVPFAPEASRWAVEHQARSGASLPDGRWAIGSQGGGILLLTRTGGIDEVIDGSVGLADETVAGMAVDPDGALWLALFTGLAKIEVGSPLSVIDRRSGLLGAANDAVVHRGSLWVATSVGLFTTRGANPPRTGEPGEGAKADHCRVRQVPEVPAPTWSVASSGEGLLVGTSAGVWADADTAPTAVAGTEGVTTYVLQPSEETPGRFWLGTRDGLAAVVRDGSAWRFEGFVPGVPRYVRRIVERGSVLWAATTFGGIARVELAPGRPITAPARIGTRGSVVDPGLFLVGNRLLVAHEDEVLAVDERTGELIADPSLAELAPHEPFWVMFEDLRGNLWLNTVPPRVARPRSPPATGWGPPRTWFPIPARDIQSLGTFADGVVWLGSESGLFLHSGILEGERRPLPVPRVARVVEGERVLFPGPPASMAPSLSLGPRPGRLRIELSPMTLRRGISYQTRIDPVDAAPSSWSASPFVDLAGLPEGDFTLRFRTRSADGEVSPEAAWTFRVLPAWYRTRWAMALWIVSALLAAGGWSRFRSWSLRRRAVALEREVAVQTEALEKTIRELSDTQSEVLAKNRLLAEANARLAALSQRDDLTGVANRRRLFEALGEEWRRAIRARAPLAFVLLDLDHFKLLNDTAGHTEGDEALRRVAAFLQSRVRREGEIVARYGGEELALLLPGVDLAAAAIKAEELRGGVEELGIPHPGTELGVLTASFGVAAVVPAPGDRPEALVETADAALYRAKRAGRNRVALGGAELVER